MAIVNPAAGGGRAAKLADSLLPKFGELDVRRTVGPGHATVLVREAHARGVDRFLSLGGDGTLHEVVNGLTGEGPRATVGICPVGTGNSFGRDIGVLNPEDALSAWTSGGRQGCDLLRLTHADGELHAINLVGLGFAAVAGDLMNRRFKRLGVAGYIAAVLVEVSRLNAPVMRYRIGDEAYEEAVLMLSICNSRYTGGDMCMAPAALIDDGMLDVIRLGPMSRPRFLSAFPKIFKGTHVDLPEVRTHAVRRIELDLDQAVPVMIDGEVIVMKLEAVEVVPDALEVACLN